MPYVDPATIQNPATGDAIGADHVDGIIANQQYGFDSHPRARVYNSANIALTNGSFTTLTYNSERYDSGGCHSTVSNTSRLTVPASEGGLYVIGGNVEVTASAATIIASRLLVNGTTEIARVGPGSTGNSTAALRLLIQTEWELAAGDYVEQQVFVNAGSLNALVLSNYSPEMWFRWVATIA